MSINSTGNRATRKFKLVSFQRVTLLEFENNEVRGPTLFVAYPSQEHSQKIKDEKEKC